MILLTPLDLSLAALLIVLLAVLDWKLRIGLRRQLLVASFRTTVQLILIGFVLKLLFAQVSLPWVALLATIMLLAAGREVMQRQKMRFRGGWGYGLGTGAMFVSAFSVTLLTLAVIIGADPWYHPQYAIPLLGMLLGNTMNGIALGIDRLTRGAREQRHVIEARLMLGHSAHEAVQELRKDSMRVGMIPMINAMAAAGIVSLPGMMTGQILAGSPPLEAVKYQILIMFIITAGTGFGTLAAVSLAARRLFDERLRLRLDRLEIRNGG